MANLASIDHVPTPSKETGQRSIPISEAYFARIIPSWSQPSVLLPEQWRAWVKSQPVAVACKDTMISNISDLDWKITPRESDQRDELKGTIRHYEKLLQQGGGSMDWVSLLEWTLGDALDLPFGSAWEVGRKGDTPDGRVMWLKPIDGGTCYPTNNDDFPVYQYYNGYDATFPKHAVARLYFNPRPEIERSGWGVAPPERIFLAMEMIARGDKYYANLLLDIPPVGVFDLADVSWEDARTWIESFRNAVTGMSTVDSFKIPVLAEHTGKAEFIALGKPPADIMYDRITLKYASLVCAGYGMNLGDIGVASASSSGETLAGSIRGEQKTNRTGKARCKAKLKYFFESFLPPTLQFDFIDTDGERLSMLGRARLANATAFNQLREMEAISPEEARLQAIQDGLLTISMPEKPPKEAKKENPLLGQPFGAKPGFGKKPPERPGSVGAPQPPSLGGDGEVKKSLVFLPSKLNEVVEKVVSVLAPNIREALVEVGDDDYEPMKSAILNTVFSEEDELGLGSALNALMGSVKIGEFDIEGLRDEINELLKSEGLDASVDLGVLKAKFEQNFPAFLGKAIVYTLVNSERLFAGDVVENVQERINRSLVEYATTFVGIELGRMLEEIRQAPQEVPQVLRLRTVVQKPPQTITVEAPQITMPPISVVVPERSVQVGTPDVNVYPPDVNVNFPKQDAPVVNVSVPAQEPPQVKVDVSVPERAVTVTAPQITVNTPEQQVPQVTVEVQPTPVEVRNEVTVQPAKVEIPKPVREIQQVHRDINQNIAGTTTDIEYK